MRKVLMTAAMLGFSFSGLALAQSVTMKPDEIIAARQGGMALVGGLAETMKAAVASGAEVKPFAEGAASMAKWGKQYTSLYPNGTQTGLDTKAKPEIWSDWAGFEKADAAFVTASEKLEEAAKSGDKAAFAAAFKDVGATCGGCHRNYKAR
jgi:cytochrome c556